MFESVAVLVVFAFLLVFGINFYFGIAKTSVAREIERASHLRVFGLAQKAAFLPELDCAIGGISEEACIDAGKLRAFEETLKDPSTATLYFPVFGWSTVNVTLLYPPQQALSILLYDNPLPEYTLAKRVQVPMLIYNTTQQEKFFGIVEVTYYATS